jgi:hypothetical protein
MAAVNGDTGYISFLFKKKKKRSQLLIIGKWQLNDKNSK